MRSAMFLLMIFTVSCGEKATDESSLQYKVANPSYAGLTRKVFKDSIKVCFNAQDNTEIQAEDARYSILKWIDALRDVTDRPLAAAVTIVDFKTPCDVKLYVGNFLPARTSLGATPVVYVHYTGWYGSRNVILHEFGHAFGLLDTYRGGGGSCQPGQPDSVMCSARYLDLTTDDVNGIRRMFQLVESGAMGVRDPDEPFTLY